MAHSHDTEDSGRSIKFGLVLNSIYTVIEFCFGIVTGSLALIADATHNLTDTLTLAVSFTANKLARRKADTTRTYGYGRVTILAALLNAFIMVGVASFIVYEAIQRLQHPQPVEGGIVALVAFVGILVNGSIAYILSKHSKDLNMRSAFVDMLFDALSSFGAVVAGIAILLTGINGIDSIVGLLIAAMLLYNTVKIIKEAVHILLEGTRNNIDLTDVKKTILAHRLIEQVDDLHVWTIRSGYRALSCHVVIDKKHIHDSRKIVEEVKEKVKSIHDIQHPTIEIEFEDATKKDSHESH